MPRDPEHLPLDGRKRLLGQHQALARQPWAPQERDGTAAGTVGRPERDDLPADRRQLDGELPQLGDERAGGVGIGGEDLELDGLQAHLRVGAAQQDDERCLAASAPHPTDEVEAVGDARVRVVGRHGHVHPVGRPHDEAAVVAPHARRSSARLWWRRAGCGVPMISTKAPRSVSHRSSASWTSACSCGAHAAATTGIVVVGRAPRWACSRRTRGSPSGSAGSAPRNRSSSSRRSRASCCSAWSSNSLTHALPGPAQCRGPAQGRRTRSVSAPLARPGQRQSVVEDGPERVAALRQPRDDRADRPAVRAQVRVVELVPVDGHRHRAPARGRGCTARPASC